MFSVILCSRIVGAAPNKVFVLPANGKDVAVQLREQDMQWKDLLSSASHLDRYLVEYLYGTENGNELMS